MWSRISFGILRIKGAQCCCSLNEKFNRALCRKRVLKPWDGCSHKFDEREFGCHFRFVHVRTSSWGSSGCMFIIFCLGSYTLYCPLSSQLVHLNSLGTHWNSSK